LTELFPQTLILFGFVKYTLLFQHLHGLWKWCQHHLATLALYDQTACFRNGQHFYSSTVIPIPIYEQPEYKRMSPTQPEHEHRLKTASQINTCVYLILKTANQINTCVYLIPKYHPFTSFYSHWRAQLQL